MSATGFQRTRRNIRKNNQVQDVIVSDVIVPYAELGWPELKKYAAEKGIDVKGKKKEEILKALADMEG